MEVAAYLTAACEAIIESVLWLDAADSEVVLPQVRPKHQPV